jgi:hypothetical protein
VRVLGGDDEEGRGQGAGLAFDRDLLLLHRLQQRALRLGAGAVDLVGQQHLREDRAGVEDEGFLAALVDRHAGQVAGHQVGGELHAREMQAEGAGQRMGEGGLADARNVLDQQVPTGQQAGHAVAHLGLLADDHRVKLVQQPLSFLCFHQGMTLSEFRLRQR